MAAPDAAPLASPDAGEFTQVVGVKGAAMDFGALKQLQDGDLAISTVAGYGSPHSLGHACRLSPPPIASKNSLSASRHP
ncbi:MAG: hypothetical protein ACJ8H8_28485 [Geminicoccaceae bacterium]